MGKFINTLFEKYKNLKPHNHHLKKEYKEVLEEIFKISIDDQDITVRSGVMFLTAPPTLKSEIFLRKQEIIKKLNSKLSKTSKTIITDLR